MSHSFIIKSDAIIVSDVHYSDKDISFSNFLDDIIDTKIITSQLILLGDVFEVLIGGFDISISRNKSIVDKINYISKSIDIVYLEGNHDYQLTNIFPNVFVIPLSLQPTKFILKDTVIYLAHGDWCGNILYKIYTYIIRNRYIIKFLNYFFTNKIISILDDRDDKKENCYKINFFEAMINKKFKKCDIKAFDIFIEGHYHQGVSFKKTNSVYINVSSFACNKRYFIVQSLQEVIYRG